MPEWQRGIETSREILEWATSQEHKLKAKAQFYCFSCCLDHFSGLIWLEGVDIPC